jgi:hypothetical protein
MVVGFEELNYLVTDLVGMDLRHDQQTRWLVKEAVTSALRIYRDEMPDKRGTPPMRALKGELFKRLSGVDRRPAAGAVAVPSEPKPVSLPFVAAVVLAAFDAAVLWS